MFAHRLNIEYGNLPSFDLYQLGLAVKRLIVTFSNEFRAKRDLLALHSGNSLHRSPLIREMTGKALTGELPCSI